MSCKCREALCHRTEVYEPALQPIHLPYLVRHEESVTPDTINNVPST